VRKIIHYYKYFGLYDLADNLVEIYQKSLSEVDFDLITWVPLSAGKQKKRGFNQAELIARGLSVRFGCPVWSGLFRIKYRKSQVGLDREDRLMNVKGNFRAQTGLSGEKVLLVDDVCTTMATLNECSRELKRAGAGEVWGVVLGKR